MGKYANTNHGLPVEYRLARFFCECGSTPTDNIQVVAHALSGHDIRMERYRNGRWRNSGVNVADVMLKRLQERGESTEEFISRIERYADRLEELAAVQEAEAVALEGNDA